MKFLPAVTGLDNIQLVPENKSQNTNKSLSVLIHQDGLSFYIYTSSGIESSFSRSFKYASNPIEILKSIEECYEKEAILGQEFEKVRLIYHHEVFTLVPVEFFEEAHAADYLKYNTRLLQTDTISVDESIPQTGAHLVYVAYSNINNYFYEKYGTYSYFHYSSLSLPQLAHKNDGLFIEVMESHFYVTLFKEGILIAHNLFQHEQIEDILFYTLFAAEKNGLDPEIVPLTILQKEENKELFDLLYTYVRNVEVLPDYQTYLSQLICA